MGKKAVVRLAFVIYCLLLPSATQAFEGPLQVVNQFPLFMHIDAPSLESASLEDSFSAGLSHSSVYLVKNSAQWYAGLDMEITELRLRYKRSINGSVELGIEAPFVSFNAGFMDGFIDSYHNAFGFPDYGRSGRPDNEFLYEVRRNGKLVIQGRSGSAGVGDIKLSLKKIILKDDPVISVRAEIELPTGNPERGFGSGSIDTGIAIILDKNIGERFRTFWNFGAVLPGNLKAHDDTNLKGFIYGGAGIETFFLKNFDFAAQMLFQTSPFPETGIGAIDRTSVLLSLGGRYCSGNNSLEISLTEDPNTAGAPDFTLNLSYKRRL